MFYEGGFGRTGVEAIADAAKVTKRTFYYHFRSKDDLLGAVLDAQHELALRRFQRWAVGARDNPVLLVEALFREFAAWANRPGWQASGFTRAAMELADLPGHPARSAARRHKAAIENWLTQQFEGKRVPNPNLLARQILLLIEGCHSLVLIHGTSEYIDVAAETARLITLDALKRGSTPASRRCDL